jgi:hypothetical protein
MIPYAMAAGIMALTRLRRRLGIGQADLLPADGDAMGGTSDALYPSAVPGGVAHAAAGPPT